MLDRYTPTAAIKTAKSPNARAMNPTSGIRSTHHPPESLALSVAVATLACLMLQVHREGAMMVLLSGVDHREQDFGRKRESTISQTLELFRLLPFWNSNRVSDRVDFRFELRQGRTVIDVHLMDPGSLAVTGEFHAE